MEQTKVEGALKRLWKEYIKVKIESEGNMGDVKEKLILYSITKTSDIVEYVERRWV